MIRAEVPEDGHDPAAPLIVTLTRRVALLVAAVLLLAAGGSFAVHGSLVRQALQFQLELRNRDTAHALALAAGPLWLARTGAAASDGPDALTAVLAEQFALGRDSAIRLRGADGRPLVALERPGSPLRAPAWFVRLLPVSAPAGEAAIGGGSGWIVVQADAAAAQDALWDAFRDTAALLVALAAAAAAVATGVLRAWRRPLEAAVAQAQALAEGRFLAANEPPLPELQGLSRSMNATVHRLRDIFAAQAEQVALLQRQAQIDDITGLALRPHFIGQLQHHLAVPGPGAALLLVRVLQLEALNPRLGHEGTDRLLAAIGDVLLTYVERVPGTFAGRLNGSDFALCLPVAGVAHETAVSLRAALAASPVLRNGGGEVVVAGADGLHDVSAGAALAAADHALARAEAGVEAGSEPDTSGGIDSLRAADTGGARAWREQIAAALGEGRAELAEYRVVDAGGRTLHLECPLRVQLHQGGDFESAGRWLSLARRSRLMPQVDLLALELALGATAADGLRRAVHASSVSLQSGSFVAEVMRRLQAAPAAAQRLSIEFVEGPRPADGRALLARAAATWRPLGVRLGVEHAGASPHELPGLQDVGIAYIKVAARHLRGIAADAAVRGYAQSLVALIHGLGLQAVAEGMDGADDLAALWGLGFDGATGPGVANGQAVDQATSPT